MFDKKKSGRKSSLMQLKLKKVGVEQRVAPTVGGASKLGCTVTSQSGNTNLCA